MRTFVNHDVSELLFRLLFSSIFVVLGAEHLWLWDLYQRSNFIKNDRLLGVCLHLLTHEPGRTTLPGYLQRR